MEMELQTHTIPDEEHALYRLARSLGFDSVEKFLSSRKRTRRRCARFTSRCWRALAAAQPEWRNAPGPRGIAESARQRRIRGCARRGEGGRKPLAWSGVRACLAADEGIVRATVPNAVELGGERGGPRCRTGAVRQVCERVWVTRAAVRDLSPATRSSSRCSCASETRADT